MMFDENVKCFCRNYRRDKFFSFGYIFDEKNTFSNHNFFSAGCIGLEGDIFFKYKADNLLRNEYISVAKSLGITNMVKAIVCNRISESNFSVDNAGNRTLSYDEIVIYPDKNTDSNNKAFNISSILLSFNFYSEEYNANENFEKKYKEEIKKAIEYNNAKGFKKVMILDYDNEPNLVEIDNKLEAVLKYYEECKKGNTKVGQKIDFSELKLEEEKDIEYEEESDEVLKKLLERYEE